MPVNITAAGASPTETSAWEDLEKPSGPSLSPRAGSVLAKTVPSLFAQPVPKTSRGAEPPTGFSDPAAQRLCSTKRQDILISPSWTIFCCLSSKPGFGTNLLLSVFFFTFFFHYYYYYYFYVVLSRSQAEMLLHRGENPGAPEVPRLRLKV